MKHSATFLRCVDEAKQNADLFPSDCINILEKNYGVARMENFNPETIRRMVRDLMGTNCEPDNEEIKKIVNIWLNTF